MSNSGGLITEAKRSRITNNYFAALPESRARATLGRKTAGRETWTASFVGRSIMKKFIAIAAIAIVAVIIGVVVYIGSNIDGIVKAGVETYGPRFTGSEVRVANVSSSLLGGEVSVEGLFLGNPKGFKTAHAFKVNQVKVAVDIGSITSDVVRIKEIVIDAPDIIYEMAGTSSNIQAIQANVAKAAGASESSSSSSSSGPGKKVVIDNLYVRNSKAAVSAGMLGGKVVPLPLPDIHLTDIGKKSNGATMSEASKQVLDAITKAATDAVSKVDLKGLAEGAGKALEGVTKDSGKMLDDATKGGGDALKGAGDQLKGLFGK